MDKNEARQRIANEIHRTLMELSPEIPWVPSLSVAHHAARMIVDLAEANGSLAELFANIDLKLPQRR